MAITEQSSTIGERISRIEGGYEHLATKADVAEVKAEIADVKSELKSEIAEVRGDIRGIKWWVISIGSAAVILSALAQMLPLGG